MSNPAPATVRKADDDLSAGFEAPLSPEVVRELSTLSPALAAGHVALEWAGIAGAVWLAETFRHPLLYVLTVLWIGGRQHALAVLAHEGAHYRLAGKGRLNDVLSEVLCAWPVFLTTRFYRLHHFAHHRQLNTNEDPDWVRKQTEEWRFPKSRGALARILAREVLALNTPSMLLMVLALSGAFAKERSRSFWRYQLLRLAWCLAVGAAVAGLGLGREVLLYWVVPWLTWFAFALRLRSIAEHFAIENDHVYTATRTTLPTLLERLFLIPKNVGYHLEHHLYPSVPFYALPRLHAALNEHATYRDRAHVTRSYLGVLGECVGIRHRPATAASPAGSAQG